MVLRIIGTTGTFLLVVLGLMYKVDDVNVGNFSLFWFSSL